MEINEIIERNYNATVRRRLITNKTTCSQFATAIRNELVELEDTLDKSKITLFDISELADIVLVCHSMAKHFGYNLVSEMEKKTLFNETRK